MTFNVERRSLGHDNVRKEKRALRVEKFVEGEWIEMGSLTAEEEWRGATLAKALGGSVRMVRSNLVVREWIDGV